MVERGLTQSSTSSLCDASTRTAHAPAFTSATEKIGAGGSSRSVTDPLRGGVSASRWMVPNVCVLKHSGIAWRAARHRVSESAVQPAEEQAVPCA